MPTRACDKATSPGDAGCESEPQKLFKRVCVCHVPCVGTPALSGLRWNHPQAHRTLNPSTVGVGQEACYIPATANEQQRAKFIRGIWVAKRETLKGISLGGSRGQRGVEVLSPAPPSWAKLPASSAKIMRKENHCSCYSSPTVERLARPKFPTTTPWMAARHLPKGFVIKRLHI